MVELNVILSGFLIGVTFILWILGYYSYKRKEVPGAKGLYYLCVVTAFYTFGYAMELTSTSVEAINIWSKFQYIGLPFIPAFWVYMTLSYIQKNPKSNMFYFFLYIVPALTCLFRLTSEWHQLQYGPMTIGSNGYFGVLAFEKGPWYYFHFFYLFICAVYTSRLYINLYSSTSGYQRKQSTLMLGASVIPIVSILLNLTGTTPLQLDSGPFFVVFNYGLLGYGIFRIRLMNIIPLSRDKVFDWISDGVIVTDLQMNLLDYNPSAKKIFDVLDQAALNCNLFHVLRHNTTLVESITSWLVNADRDLIEGEADSFHFTLENAEGAPAHYQVRVSDIFDSGLHVGKILIITDTTEQRKMLLELERLARTDKLTGLTNRGHFIDLFNARFNDDTLITEDDFASDLRLAIIMFDIDHFKDINDTFGHQAGDLVLKELSHTVQKSLRHDESVCRYGGEEFAVLLSETTLEEAQQVAERLRHEIEMLKIDWEGKHIKVTASFGVTFYELLKTSRIDHHNTVSFEQLMHQADQALYLAKADGRNCVKIIL